MEIGTQIKQHRTAQRLSQEELAEQVYVTRQTLSNWETGKTYPDINSLLRLADLFHVSLDELVKGDIPKMKEQINQTDVKEFKKASNIFTILFVTMVLSTIPLMYFLGKPGFIIWVVLAAIALLYAFHVEKLKKQHNIQTYKEITAFMEGTRLDELTAAEEKGKRPYQKVLLVAASTLLGALLGALYAFVTKG